MAKNYGRARKNNYGKNSFNNKKTFNSKFSEAEKLAYKMGQIDAGRSRESLIADSYNAGVLSVSKEQMPKKSKWGKI